MNDRCDICNAELSQCGPLADNGEPTLDCEVCMLRNRLNDMTAERDAFQKQCERQAHEANKWSKKYIIMRDARDRAIEALKTQNEFRYRILTVVNEEIVILCPRCRTAWNISSYSQCDKCLLEESALPLIAELEKVK